MRKGGKICKPGMEFYMYSFNNHSPGFSGLAWSRQQFSDLGEPFRAGK